MGFGTGLLNAAAAGARGYAEGDQEARRRAIVLAAQQRAEKAQADRLALDQQEFGERQEQNRIKNRMGGYTPATSTLSVLQPGEEDAPAPTAPTDRTFADALGAMGATTGMPTAPSKGPLDLPAAPGLGGVPRVKVLDTPETFDPTQTTAAVVAGIHDDGATARAQAAIDARSDEGDKNRQSRELIARLREKNRADGRAAVGQRPMTATAKEANARQAARALLAIHGGKAGAAAWLAGPDGAEARAQGVTPFHLDVADGLVAEKDGGRAVGAAASGSASPQRAVARVQATRAAADSANAARGRSLTTPAPTASAPPPVAPAGPPPRATNGSTNATTTGLPPLTPAQIQRAATDGEYKAFKVSQGYKL